MKETNIKEYSFEEKKKEKWKNSKTGDYEDLEVYQTPKYLQSKKKAIELIEKGDYSLDEGDFWILKNKSGSKLCYTGLIISHNGCLKINHKLEDKLKFKPSSVSFVKDEAEKIKVMQYINDEQGVYEFGEISPKNCQNDYPYAMVLKRLMDRVILKNSAVGFFGIYSDSESEDFKEKIDDDSNKASEQPKKQPIKTIDEKQQKEIAKLIIQAKIPNFLEIMKIEKINDLPESRYNKVIQGLNKKIEENKNKNNQKIEEIKNKDNQKLEESNIVDNKDF